jgi:3-dehydroquinate synthase
MEEIIINTPSGRSKVLLGERFLNINRHLPHNQVVIITDTNVAKCYSGDFPPFPVIEIGFGEKNKNLDTVRYIYDKLIELEVDRSCFILGIGGGVICDIVGFVASTYMRGLDFGFVSTSLLSQVDASIGGKNGVNFHGFKNMIGIIRQPSFVLCDYTMLKSLPEKEYLAGLAEIVKYAVIRDRVMFEILEKNTRKILERDIHIISGLISASVKIKAEIVEKDELEKGERRLLNFGHTFGHAIENIYHLSHGEAISLGMIIAANFSTEKGLMPLKSAKRLERLLDNLHLITKVSLDKDNVLDTMRKDKKKYGTMIYFIMPESIGNAVVHSVPFGDLERYLLNFEIPNLDKETRQKIKGKR